MEEVNDFYRTVLTEETARDRATDDEARGICPIDQTHIERRALHLAYFHCPFNNNFCSEDRQAFVSAYSDTIKELRMSTNIDTDAVKYDSIDYSLMKHLLLKVCNDEGNYFRELLRDLYQLESDKDYFRLSGQYHPMYHNFYESLVKKSFVVGSLEDVIEHYHRLIDNAARELINNVMPGPEE